MKIAIDVSALKSAHQFRGIGFYTQRLIESLKKFDKKNKYVLVEKPKDLDNYDSDLVHYPYFDLFFHTLSFKKPKSIVVTIHDVIPLVFPKKFPRGIKGWLKFQMQKYSLQSVKAVITDSENSKKDIIKYLSLPKEKIFVVPLAPGKEFRPLTINDKLLVRLRRKYSLSERFVLYVGDVNWNKNVPGLVRASEKVKIPLVIVGKQAASRDYDRKHPENQDLVWLQDYDQRLKNKGQGLILTGFLPTEDLVAIYNLASVYCQPSFYEGFCLPVLEAMACGAPVVCSQVSSLPEVVANAALFINPHDSENIGWGIKKVFGQKGLAEKLREKGLSRAKKFSWEKTAKETIKVYEEASVK